MKDGLTREELEEARKRRLAERCAVCDDTNEDGRVAYGCEACGRMVCGMCLQEGEPDEYPYCLDCEKPEATT